MLDMGKPVKILQVAEHLISHHSGPVEIEFTGLREGEKLHEDLFGSQEPRDVRPWHPLVSHVPVDPVDLDLVSNLPTEGQREDVVNVLRMLSTYAARSPRFASGSREMGDNLFQLGD